MDALRRVMWWTMAYGSVGCLWMAAEVKAGLSGQPESSDAVNVVYYEPVKVTGNRVGTPTDNTLLNWRDLDARPHHAN
jgi:hypothetical protein